MQDSTSVSSFDNSSIEMTTVLDGCKGGKSQPVVNDDSNENIFELGSDPVIEEQLEVTIDRESETIEQGGLIYINFTLNLILPETTGDQQIDKSNESPVIVNSENFPTMPVPTNDTIPDSNSVTQVEENLEIFDVGAISTETENSAAPTDLSFLDFSSPAPQEPETPEPEPVQSGTDQLLDFLS